MTTRDDLVLFYEGQALTMAGQVSREFGAMHTRCMVDGAINALLRIDGADNTALYTSQLADRALLRLRAPTEFVPLKPMVEVAAPLPASSLPPLSHQRPTFWMGFAFGAICAAALIMGLRR